MASANYTAKDITVLEGLEPVRKRPGMYIGGVGSTGLHHLIWEVVDNAIDEAMNGYASNIRVTLHEDGSSITVFFVEMLRGDGGKNAVSVQRQHVRLKAAALKTLKVGDGVKDFADDKNIAADRGSAWIDGRFLRATTNATRGMMDPKPDVDCGGEGGLAGVRMAGPVALVGIGDGSVRSISPALTFVTWQNACNASDGNVLGADW